MIWLLIAIMLSGEERVWERYRTLGACLRDLPAVAQTLVRDLRIIGCVREGEPQWEMPS